HALMRTPDDQTDNLPNSQPSLSITGPVQAALGKVGYVGDPEAIVASYTTALGLGLNRLSAEEMKRLDEAITPDAAFLMTKAFGPQMAPCCGP
ncbi:MAG: hypothetical protein H8E94_03650, partial [Alphaproteobacteria bacterium]|nr:hypothetical protein [Alphaproteobacteria bacterium]